MERITETVLSRLCSSFAVQLFLFLIFVFEVKNQRLARLRLSLPFSISSSTFLLLLLLPPTTTTISYFPPFPRFPFCFCCCHEKGLFVFLVALTPFVRRV